MCNPSQQKPQPSRRRQDQAGPNPSTREVSLLTGGGGGTRGGGWVRKAPPPEPAARGASCATRATLCSEYEKPGPSPVMWCTGIREICLRLRAGILFRTGQGGRRRALAAAGRRQRPPLRVRLLRRSEPATPAPRPPAPRRITGATEPGPIPAKFRFGAPRSGRPALSAAALIGQVGQSENWQPPRKCSDSPAARSRSWMRLGTSHVLVYLNKNT